MLISREIIGPLVFSAGGLTTYIFILNRYILHFRNGVRKLFCIAAGFVIFIPGFTSIGIVAGISAWLVIPGILVTCGAALELHRLFVQRIVRGESPVCDRGPTGSFMNPVTTMNLRLCRFSIPCPGLTTRLRISLVSDLHLNDEIPRAYYHRALDHAVSAEPDLIFFAGDFVTSRRSIPLLRDVLKGVSTRSDSYAVLGNHDYWVGPAMITDLLGELGIRTLRNEVHRITREDGSVIVLSGCEDPWGTEAWIPPGDVNGAPIFVLSHTPDNIYRLSLHRVSAVFSGHYHGGQMRIPGIGGILIPSIYGKRFEHGHFVINGTHLFVSAGVGVAVPPVRLFSHPDIMVIDLHPPRINHISETEH